MNASFSFWVRPVVLALAITASTTTASAGIIVPGTEQAHLDFAGDPMFQSVGWIAGYGPDGVKIAGSGVLIAPNWVLTAAHVLDNGWDSVAFSFDSEARASGNLTTADAWYMYPGFVSDGGAGTNNDIALIHLTVPIVGVTPAVIYDGVVPEGTHAYWSGYGRLGYYPSGEIPPSGTKRGGENVIDRIGWPLLGIQDQYMMADFGPAWGTPTMALEMGGSSGDSGSGWYADINGEMQLIGIATLTRGQFSNTGVIRPATYTDWINSTTAVPEPSSALLLLGTLPVLLAARRRQALGR